ncbi:hypothetical protein [Candidatus Bodocaedibacter vickermanii]|uniref:Uncharacterized protein n=1 Tax=Candidatus Bodocaedibacter vickermanii TaxID=2741701 RepID=A0A7L9RUN4_9PROT|nr:hypothetical protein CPBP_00856 [Candidatus Paracaedibacteraceae bacterium 'Lake Konstanz']
MIKKTLKLCLLIGLVLPITKGSETIELIVAEQSPKSSFLHLVERGKEIQARILEQNLLSYMGRHDKLTERSSTIDRMLALFLAHLRHAQQPITGYDTILEDIRAHPDAAEVARQLLQMEELFGLIRTGQLSADTLAQVTANLDKRKQKTMAIRLGVIMQRVTESQIAKEITLQLLEQTRTMFEGDKGKLRLYRDEEAVSKWTLDSLLLADLAAPADEERPSLLADVVRDYIELTQSITTEEAAHLQKNIGLLQTNREQLVAILEEARAQEKTPTSDAMIAALEKDIADIDGFILRDHQRLEKLSSPAHEK